MPTSDDQLKKKQDKVEELRKELAAREAETLRLQRERENDVTASQLDSEAESLQAQINAKNEEITALGGDPDGVTVKKTRSTTGTDEALKVASEPAPPTDKKNDEKKEG